MQFSDDELISWNNEYFKYMDNKLNIMYEAEVSFYYLKDYSFFLYRMSQVYTTSKDNYILYLEYIKKYISKYGSKTRNYWKYLKNKLKKNNSELVSATIQLKLEAKDGKKYNSDTLNTDGIIMLAKEFPSNQGSKFLDWFTNSDNTIDGKSKQRAYALFDSELLDTFEVGTIKGLQQIHSYLFAGLFDFAGKVRTKTISKGGFMFANGDYLPTILSEIEKMPENTYDEIVKKYIEMNIAHPFLEGNGRSTRLWLDLIFKKNIGKCVDWSKIDKKEYLNAMKESVLYPNHINELLKNALTDEVENREIFMKGIDYSYYYEEE